MFKDIVSNGEAKSFLQKELFMDRKAGTYLFYGPDRGLLFDFALAFTKGFNCRNEINDFCDQCEVCKRIDHLTYGDLEVIESDNGIKIDQIRKMIYDAATTSYEGGKKVFILKNIDHMGKEAINSMLKVIEEPKEGIFFILLSGSLNILSTIKSRSILVPIRRESAEDLGVTQGEYEFFLGNSKEIKKYLNLEEKVNLKTPESYEMIGEHIKKYKTLGEFQDKIKIYKALRDYILNKHYLDKLEGIFFCEEILRGGGDRALVKEIITYAIELVKSPEKMEELLILKSIQRQPISLKNLLITFFLSL